MIYRITIVHYIIVYYSMLHVIPYYMLCYVMLYSGSDALRRRVPGRREARLRQVRVARRPSGCDLYSYALIMIQY